MANAVSRAILEVLLDRIQQGAATLSPEAQLIYLNQRFASMLGRSRAELVGKPFAELVAEPEREALAAALAAGRDTAAQCRLTLPRPNGSGDLHALLTLAPLGHGQASCLVTDITQAPPGNALAHEVRNILGTTRNAVEVLKRSPPEGDAQRAVDALERQTARILELLNSQR